MENAGADYWRVEASQRLAKGDFAGALQASDSLLELQPDDVFGLYAKSYCLTRDKRPQARDEIKALCGRIISIAERSYRRTLDVYSKNSIQWAYNALAWYACDESKGESDLRTALLYAQIGCGIQYDDTFNGIFDTRVQILGRLGDEQEVGIQVRRKLDAQPDYAPFQKFKDRPGYRDWLKGRKPQTAAEALAYFDSYAQGSPYFPYSGVTFTERLTGEFIRDFEKSDFRLPPCFVTLAVEKGLPSFPSKPEGGFGSLSCEVLHPYQWSAETDELIETFDEEEQRELPEGLAVFQYYRFESASDFFVFNTGRRRKSGELEIGAMFHDEPYSAYEFKSFDEHIVELVERLITGV